MRIVSFVHIWTATKCRIFCLHHIATQKPQTNEPPPPPPPKKKCCIHLFCISTFSGMINNDLVQEYTKDSQSPSDMNSLKATRVFRSSPGFHLLFYCFRSRLPWWQMCIIHLFFFVHRQHSSEWKKNVWSSPHDKNKRFARFKLCAYSMPRRVGERCFMAFTKARAENFKELVIYCLWM